MKKTRLDQFDPTKNLVRGRSKSVEALWYLFKRVFFLTSIPWPNSIQVAILKGFGAKVGQGVNIKPRVNIHLPWKLEIEDFVWIGEEVFILNFEPVKIGSNACISQRAFLCTGNHDFRSIDFAFRNAPITIGAGAWVGAQVFVGPGVSIGDECVISAGSNVYQSLPENMVCSGTPCQPVKPRWVESD